MRTFNLAEFRRQSFGHAMKHVLAECDRFGIANLWDTDLRRVPAVRSAALAGDDRLEVAIDQALHHATHAQMDLAARLLCERRRELIQLDAEAKKFRAAAVPVADVVVLDDDWGKRGRAARIIAAIRAEGLNAAQVAERFQLAISTAKRYVRQAAKRTLAVAA